MTKPRRKHNSTVPNGRFLKSADVERLLYGEAVPDAQRRANASAAAKEALSYIELGKAALAQQTAKLDGRERTC